MAANYSQIKPVIYDCKTCRTRCDGVTVPKFDFKHDVDFSEAVENEVTAIINKKYPGLFAVKTRQDGFPDIEVSRINSSSVCLYIEIKVQSRMFMSVQKYLPDSGLHPSETLALNLSDLERYFRVKEREGVPVFITWCLLNRPCMVGTEPGSKRFFSQNLDELKKIRLKDKNDTRRFRRASGEGDVVDGVHKGVVINYHFSILELFEGLPDLSEL